MAINLDAIDTDTLYAQPPPKFGHCMLKHFAMEPGYTNLNHGSYGSSPLPVLKAVHDFALEAEAAPDRFHRLDRPLKLIAAREQIAKLIGAKTDEVVLTTNTSMGVTTVLRNIEWECGDTILITNTTYDSVYRTIQYLSNVPPHPTFTVLTLNYPLSHDEILTRFREKVRSLPLGKRRVAVIDAIVSIPGVLLPWEGMVKICAEEGVLSVVDAAHAIGQQVDINLSETKPDFWISNLHKWLYVRRSCAVLYIAERNQHIIKSSIPTSYSYRPVEERTGPGLVDQFDWNGTIDCGSYLSIAAALAFRNWIGPERVINDYCHSLALQGGRLLASILKTRVLDPQGDLTLNMVNVQLPLPGADLLPFTPELNIKLYNKLFRERNISAAYFVLNGKWWTRCCAQVYNEISDFERLGQAWIEVCKEIIEEHKLPLFNSETDVM